MNFKEYINQGNINFIKNKKNRTKKLNSTQLLKKILCFNVINLELNIEIALLTINNILNPIKK